MRNKTLLILMAGLLVPSLALAAGTAAATQAADPWMAACQQWAEKVETTISEGDAQFLADSFDEKAIIDEAAKGLSLPNEMIRGFRAGPGQNFALKFCRNLCEAMSKSESPASYKLLRLQTAHGQTKALFRMIANGVNYHEMLLAPGPDGAVVVRDMDIAAMGQSLRSLFRDIMIPLAAKYNRTANSDAASSFMNDLMCSRQDTARLTQMVRSGKGAEAMKYYDKLPATIQNLRSILILRLMAAAQMGDEAYRAAFDDFAKRFPNDPAKEILSLDYLLSKKDYQGFRASLDRLAKIEANDPYLEVLRGNSYYLQRDYARAVAAMKLAIQREPGLFPAYSSLLDIYLDQKDFANTAKMLTELETRFGLQFTKIETAPLFAQFVKSPEYKAWAKTHAPMSAPSSQPADR